MNLNSKESNNIYLSANFSTFQLQKYELTKYPTLLLLQSQEDVSLLILFSVLFSIFYQYQHASVRIFALACLY